MNQPEERSSGVFLAEPLQGHRCGHTAGREASCGQVGGAQRWGVGARGGGCRTREQGEMVQLEQG